MQRTLLLLCLAATVVAFPISAYVGNLDQSPSYITTFNMDNSSMSPSIGMLSTGATGPVTDASGLGSQNSLITYVYMGNTYMFAVNPSNDSVSAYLLPAMGMPVKVGPTVSSGGNYPVSVTASGNMVCVVNCGAMNGLRCYTFDPTNGLTINPAMDRNFGLSLTTPPAFHTGPTQISFTLDSQALVISFKNQSVSPVWMYLYKNGALAANPVKSAAGGNDGFGFDFDTDGTMILSDTDPYGTTGGVYAVNLNTAGAGSITISKPFLLPANGSCWVNRNPVTGSFYVSNAGSSSVVEIGRTNGQFMVYGTTQVGMNALPIDMSVATFNGQTYLFVLGGKSRNLYVYNANTRGTLTQVGSYPAGKGAFGVASFIRASNPTPPAPTRSSAVATAASLFVLLAAILF